MRLLRDVSVFPPSAQWCSWTFCTSDARADSCSGILRTIIPAFNSGNSVVKLDAVVSRPVYALVLEARTCPETFMFLLSGGGHPKFFCGQFDGMRSFPCTVARILSGSQWNVFFLEAEGFERTFDFRAVILYALSSK